MHPPLVWPKAAVGGGAYRISREEFQAGVADLVLSTNPADPGSSLFG